VERHLATGRVGVGSARLRLAARRAPSTVAHDAHNLVVLGVSDDDMLAACTPQSWAAGSRRRGRSRAAECPLPVAGLFSDAPLDDVIAQSRACTDAAAALGWKRRDAS